MAGIGYRPEIDGLRAFAVIPVILFHMGLNWVPGGYIGVDVFFVISGFLITSIIKKELDQGTFSFRSFWARRVRRILPAMIFVTAATLAVTYAFVFRPEQQAIGKQAVAALLSVANIYFLRNTGDYWGSAAEKSPFLHTWSLSVEEQFYVFFPIAMWLIYRVRPRWLQGCVATTAIGSLALFLWGLQNYPFVTFYLLPTRVWELGTGCLLAVSLSNQSPRISNYGIFAFVGLCMVVLSYLFFVRLNVGVGLSVFGTALIIAFGQTGLCNTLLSNRAVVHIGTISYSLYLWHWPVLVLAKHLGLDWPGFTAKVILVCIIYSLALGTYHLIERPTRRRNAIVPPIIVSGLFVVGVAFAMATKPNFYDASGFNQAIFRYYSPKPNWKSIPDHPRWMNITQENPGYYADALRDGGIRLGDKSVKPELVVVGDSHAEMWSDAIATVAKEGGIPTAFFSQCGENWWEEGFGRGRSLVYRFIYEWKPKVVVVALSWRAKRESGIKSFLEFAGAQGITVLLVEDPPWLLPCGERSSIQWLASQGVRPSGNNRQYWPIEDEAPNEGGRRWVRSLTDEYDFAKLVPVYEVFVSPLGVLVLDGKDVVHIDDDHLSSHGAHLALPLLRNAILQAIEKGREDESPDRVRTPT